MWVSDVQHGYSTLIDLTKRSVVAICHHTKLSQCYWLYSLCSRYIASPWLTYFITGHLYLLFSFTFFTIPHPPPLGNSSFFFVLWICFCFVWFICLFCHSSSYGSVLRKSSNFLVCWWHFFCSSIMLSICYFMNLWYNEKDHMVKGKILLICSLDPVPNCALSS